MQNFGLKGVELDATCPLLPHFLYELQEIKRMRYWRYRVDTIIIQI